MPQRDEVYTISDDDVLESMRRELERRGSMRPDASGGADRQRSATSRERVRYAQPPASGTRALWASTFSLFICGAGQAYNGQGKLGALLFLVEALMVSVNWSLTRLWPEVKAVADVFGVTDLQIFLSVAALDYLMVFMIMTAVYQAYRQAERTDGVFSGRDNPVVSGMASLIVPGWGQIINGQPGKAISFLFCVLSGVYTIILLALTPFPKLLNEVDAWRSLSAQLNTGVAAVLAVAGVVWVLSVYDAMLVAGFRRRMS